MTGGSGSARWAAWLAATGLMSAVAAPELNVQFDAGGLRGLRYDGVDVLANGAPAAEHVVLLREVPDTNRKIEPSEYERLAEPTGEASFDEAARRLEVRYGWGTVAAVYTAGPDRLEISLALSNTDPARKLAAFRLSLLRLALPEARLPDEPKGRVTLDHVGIVHGGFAAGEIYACYETLDPPVRFGWTPLAGPAGNETALWVEGGVPATDDDGLYHVPPFGVPYVESGGTLALTFSLRFAPPGTGEAEAAADYYRRWAAFYAPAHHWRDRRPIGMIMMPSGAEKTPVNPRGWFKDPPTEKVDITTEAGRGRFHDRILAFADRSVAVLKEINAQGMIVWDIEGDENPHPITYIGDPRLARELAPEMDEVADQFFRQFTEAGLRVGVCIRPTQVYYYDEPDESKRWQPIGWRHNAGNDTENTGGVHYGHLRPEHLAPWRFFPVVERLGDKIDYAKKRWGCTLFYIDTNGVYRPEGPDAQFKFWFVTAEMWKRIRERHPDVLLVPELIQNADDGTYHSAYYAFTAPYHELRMGVAATPDWIRALLPGAFSVLNVADSEKRLLERQAAVREGVRGGDILMLHGWWSPNMNRIAREIYEDVYPGFMDKGDAGALRE